MTDRPLFDAEHFRRFQGNLVRVRLARSLSGRRNFKGVIRAVSSIQVTLDVGGEDVVLAFTDIDAARLVPDYSDGRLSQ